MATVKDDVDAIWANSTRREPALEAYYAPRGNLDFSDPFKPVGDQSRWRRVFPAIKQLDEKSATS